MQGQEKYLDSELNLFPVILSGGSGTRLWPLSRACFPKQYLNLSHKSKNSLLQNTILRLSGLKNLQQPIIICNEEHRFIVLDQLHGAHNVESIILEPFKRNTAPAITLAAVNENEDTVLLVLPSDHLIENLIIRLKV